MEDPHWEDNGDKLLPLMEEDYEYETGPVCDEESKLQLQVFSANQEPACCRVKIAAPDGKESWYEDSPKEIVVKEPKLWWPNGLGE